MKTKYHPILFSTSMVQAERENRKTQTRRTKGLEKVNENPDLLEYGGIAVAIHFPAEKNDLKVVHYFENKKTAFKQFVKCPYEVGDVLWVRETFTEWPKDSFQYFADTALGDELGKWKPSIHMPKKACRTFLKIKSIRAERLQDISEEDSIAEGIFINKHSQAGTIFKDYLTDRGYFFNPVTSFYSLWQSINGKNSLDKNPFVWVYEFEKIEKPFDFGV